MLGCVLTLPTFLGRQMVARRTLGGLGGIVQTAPTFKDQAGRVEAPPSAGEGPHRSYVAELHKQTATAASLPPPPPPSPLPPPSSYFPLPEDPCPVKFSLATTANKTQLLRARNCEWHWRKRSVSPSWLVVCVNATTAVCGRGPDWIGLDVCICITSN